MALVLLLPTNNIHIPTEVGASTPNMESDSDTCDSERTCPATKIIFVKTHKTGSSTLAALLRATTYANNGTLFNPGPEKGV